MTDPKRKPAQKSPKPKTRSASSIRDGGTRVSVQNSGLEVWLYDDANIETILATNTPDLYFGGMPAGFEDLTRDGFVVGYSLCQDDELNVAVYVGEPFTDDELEVARWLEPQHAYLRLPSGRLCIESNDASRIGSEEPAEKGAVVDVPAGDYLLTLYRIDHEALDRERRTWEGPQEIIVLTPGGNPEQAAGDLLPFEPRRDTKWVGQYSIQGRSASALAWFGDYWDTCIVNLDSSALSELGIEPGAYLRITSPDTGISLVSTYGNSWDEARRLPPPSGVELDEYGYCSLCPMSEWDGAETLFCRRDSAKTRVEDEHQTQWLPVTVEVLDVSPKASVPAGESCVRTELRTKTWFDSGFLALILCDVLPGVDDLDELELSDALDRFDKRFAKMGLEPQGDVSWMIREGALELEAGCRFYTGPANVFATILAREGSFEVVFVSELEDGTWIVTGLADEMERRVKTKGPDGLPRPHPRVSLECMDESLSKIFKAHSASLKKAKAAPAAAPGNLDEAVAAWERFVAVAFGPPPA